MSLTTEAKAARDAELAAEKATADAERAALRQAATAALKAVLTRVDGTSLTMTEAGLSVKQTDLAAGLVVWGDADGVLLAAQLREDRWVIRLVRLIDGQHQTASDRLRTLADLGAALAAVA